MTQLTTELEQLRIEKADLVGEVEAHKLTVSHVTVTISCVFGGAVTFRVLTAIKSHLHVRSHECYSHNGQSVGEGELHHVFVHQMCHI